MPEVKMNKNMVQLLIYSYLLINVWRDSWNIQNKSPMKWRAKYNDVPTLYCM